MTPSSMKGRKKTTKQKIKAEAAEFVFPDPLIKIDTAITQQNHKPTDNIYNKKGDKIISTKHSPSQNPRVCLQKEVRGYLKDLGREPQNSQQVLIRKHRSIWEKQLKLGKRLPIPIAVEFKRFKISSKGSSLITCKNYRNWPPGFPGRTEPKTLEETVEKRIQIQ